MDKNVKGFYVHWQGYQDGQAPHRDHPLDTLCLQGPHTQEDAHRVAGELRREGFRASVIDARESLKWAIVGPELIKALNQCATVLMNCKNDTPEAAAYIAAEKALARAEGNYAS